MSLAFFASPQFGRDSVRAGIGFNLAQSGPDKDAGQERAMAYFERFQQLVAGEWKQLLTGWMTANGGFIQSGDKPPLVDMMPADAISSLVNAKNTPISGGCSSVVRCRRIAPRTPRSSATRGNWSSGSSRPSTICSRSG